MVKLYVADISHLPDPMSVPELLQTLPLERQQRIHDMKQEKSRKQSMGVGLLLQKVLALYHMQGSQVLVGEHGKPRVEGLEFNLSHSGNLVLCAVSDEPVGCDVELVRKAPMQVAERYFSSDEQVYLSQFSKEAYDREFFRLWTKKESYAKMTGEGLGAMLGKGEIEDCHISEVEVQGYAISVCAKASAPIEVIWEKL